MTLVDINIPSGEYALSRIEELEAFIESFPDSALTPIFKKEISYLESFL